MATDSDKQPHLQPAPSPGYEPRDANGKWIFVVVVGLFACIVGAEFALRWMESELKRKPQPTDQWSAARLTPSPAWTQANIPRLQVSPEEDLAKCRTREDAELNTYGWVNRTAGVVRIPIERAMDLLAQRGLPVRAGVGKSKLGPTPLELQQQRTNATQAETVIVR